jgi:IclR family acetate operon transcriptional repressor
LVREVVSSATRTIRLLDLMARRGPLGVRTIAQHLGLPLGSVHRLILDLAAESVLQRMPNGEWELSYRLLEVVGLQLERVQLPQLARTVLQQLAIATRQTTLLAVPSGNEIVYLDKVQTDLQIQLNVELGTRRPMHCTGLGKAILAFLPPAEQERFLTNAKLESFTDRTITDPGRLRQQLREARSRGYATDHEEILPGLHCLAVPVLDHLGRPVGAISIAGTAANVEADASVPVLRQLLEAGEYVSRRLGFVRPSRAHNAA